MEYSDIPGYDQWIKDTTINGKRDGNLLGALDQGIADWPTAATKPDMIKIALAHMRYMGRQILGLDSDVKDPVSALLRVVARTLAALLGIQSSEGSTKFEYHIDESVNKLVTLPMTSHGRDVDKLSFGASYLDPKRRWLYGVDVNNGKLVQFPWWELSARQREDPYLDVKLGVGIKGTSGGELKMQTRRPVCTLRLFTDWPQVMTDYVLRAPDNKDPNATGLVLKLKHEKLELRLYVECHTGKLTFLDGDPTRLILKYDDVAEYQSDGKPIKLYFRADLDDYLVYGYPPPGPNDSDNAPSYMLEKFFSFDDDARDNLPLSFLDFEESIEQNGKRYSKVWVSRRLLRWPEKLERAQDEKVLALGWDSPYDSPDTGLDWGGFVLGGDGRFYLTRHERGGSLYGGVFHSYYFSGKPILCAGGMMVDGTGGLWAVSNASGHYQPPKESLISVLQVLKSRGVDLESVIVLAIVPGTNPPEFHHYRAKKVLELGRFPPEPLKREECDAIVDDRIVDWDPKKPRVSEVSPPLRSRLLSSVWNPKIEG